MNSKYRDLAEGLSAARLTYSDRAGGATRSMTGAEWDVLARRIEGLRLELETLDRGLAASITELAVSRGWDPARVRISDLASREEADEVRSAVESLRATATHAREEAAANARYFSERIAVVEATIQVLAQAQRGPAYGPGGDAAPTPRASGFFEGRA